MLDNIQPGAKVNVKVTSQPTNKGAVKTLVRLLSKSEKAKAEDRRLTRVRHENFTPKRRGGRLYAGHKVKLHPVKGKVGEQAVITATLSVLTDLKSVSRFVEVAPA